jgi:hypothetical protein
MPPAGRRQMETDSRFYSTKGRPANLEGLHRSSNPYSSKPPIVASAGRRQISRRLRQTAPRPIHAGFRIMPLNPKPRGSRPPCSPELGRVVAPSYFGQPRDAPPGAELRGDPLAGGVCSSHRKLWPRRRDAPTPRRNPPRCTRPCVPTGHGPKSSAQTVAPSPLSRCE